MDMLERLLSEAAPVRSLVFALACCQRQLGFYTRAAQGKEWNRTSEINGLLSDLWSMTLGGKESEFDAGVLDAAMPEEAKDWAENCVVFFIQSLDEVLKIARSEDSSAALVVAEMGLSIADQLAYALIDKPPTREMDEALWEEKNGVVRNEVERQLDDIEDIAGSDFDRMAIERIMTRNISLNVTSGRWFLVES